MMLSVPLESISIWGGVVTTSEWATWIGGLGAFGALATAGPAMDNDSVTTPTATPSCFLDA
jgi:hypothetical protein